jgi:hypothetical protein
MTATAKLSKPTVLSTLRVIRRTIGTAESGEDPPRAEGVRIPGNSCWAPEKSRALGTFRVGHAEIGSATHRVNDVWAHSVDMVHTIGRS